jgi:CheY-like chemotaxis protein
LIEQRSFGGGTAGTPPNRPELLAGSVNDRSFVPGVKSVLKILVVEDESNMRFLLRMILESDGYEVVEAKHGAAALECVKEESPDLVVTDLMMPVMNGRELIERLRSDDETAAIPILVVTSNPSAEVPSGADATLPKPFDLDALLDTARSLCRKDAA